MSTASTTCGSSSVVGTEPVWPPPSPPWTSTASAPQPATFSACRLAPMDGIVTTPASFSFCSSSFFGASANDATFTPSRIIRSTRSPTSSPSERMLTPNGASVLSLTVRIAVSSSGMLIVLEAMIPSPPAAAVAAVSRAPDTQPMPVWTIGYLTPVSSVKRVVSSRLRGDAHAATSLYRRPFGSSSAMMRSSSAVGSRVAGTSPSAPAELEARSPRRPARR